MEINSYGPKRFWKNRIFQAFFWGGEKKMEWMLRKRDFASLSAVCCCRRERAFGMREWPGVGRRTIRNSKESSFLLAGWSPSAESRSRREGLGLSRWPGNLPLAMDARTRLPITLVWSFTAENDFSEWKISRKIPRASLLAIQLSTERKISENKTPVQGRSRRGRKIFPTPFSNRESRFSTRRRIFTSFVHRLGVDCRFEVYV